MSDQFRHRKHGPDDRNDADDQRTKDQSEDPVENVRLHRFEFRLQPQLGFAEFRAKQRDVRLGSKLGALGSFLDRSDDSLGFAAR